MTDSPASFTPDDDVVELARPCSQSKPAGEPLSDANEAKVGVKALRKEARDAERFQMERSQRPKAPAGAVEARSDGGKAEAVELTPDWKAVEAAAAKILTTSKDLDVAAWYLDARARTRGFSGLREGLWLYAELCRGDSPGFHQSLEIEKRLESLTNLDQRLAAVIRMTSLVQGGLKFAADGAMTFWNASRPNAPDTEAAATTRRGLQQAPVARRIEMHDAIEGAKAELDRLAGVLQERCGASPGLALTAVALEASLAAFNALAPDVEHSRPAKRNVAAAGADASAPAGEGAAAGGVIRSRAQALKLLEQVAVYLERTEPHSPLSYSVKRCVRWARLPLPELLQELLARDENARDELFRVIGIEPKKKPE